MAPLPMNYFLQSTNTEHGVVVETLKNVSSSNFKNANVVAFSKKTKKKESNLIKKGCRALFCSS